MTVATAEPRPTSSMQTIEGRLSIVIKRSANSSKDELVSICSSRPLKASHLLTGKTPDQVLSIIPLLFSVCSTAQSRTAIGCIQQALKLTDNPAIETARDMLVLVENAREHLLRLFIDWPRLFNLNPEPDVLPVIGRMLNEYKHALFVEGDAFSLDSKLHKNPGGIEQLIDSLETLLQQHVFRIPPQQWLNLPGICELHMWSQTEDSIAAKALLGICEQGLASQGLSRCPPLPAIDDTKMKSRLDQDDAQQYIEQPEWQHRCHETGAFIRQLDQPLMQALCEEFDATLLPRWTARLVELARIPQQLRNMHNRLRADAAHRQADVSRHGDGLKQVEAARGRLIHSVQIRHGIITRYRILSPTEWNFHPQGVAAQSLAALARTRQRNIERSAHILINAIDPCVGYQLRIH